MSEEIKTEIKTLKVEIFDIVRQQENWQERINQLQQIKIPKIKLLEKLEAEEKNKDKKDK